MESLLTISESGIHDRRANRTKGSLWLRVAADGSSRGNGYDMLFGDINAAHTPGNVRRR